MTKLFLIITSVALLASIVFGLQNRQSFIDNRKARAENNKKIDAALSQFEDTENPALAKSYGLLFDAENLLATHIAQKNSALEQVATLTGEITQLEGQMAPLDKELDETQKEIDSLAKEFPGVNFDNLGDVIAKLESDVDDTKQELAAKQAEIEIVSKQVATNNATIDRYEQRQVERLAAIKRNAQEGVITAVNQDWAFVVINVGKNQGIKGDSSLIVKRGGARIANLNIVEVQPDKTVADIRQDNLTGVVQPGDKVIFQRPAE